LRSAALSAGSRLKDVRGGSDETDVTTPAGLVPHPATPLATVIALPTNREVAGPDRAIDILDRRVGQAWRTLPADAGRPALHVEHLLRQAPAGVDPDTTSSTVAMAHARELVVAARAALELLSEEVATLSEVLGADLGVLAFDELNAVAGAVLDLAAAPTAVPSWGRRSAAEGAAVVLELVAPGLRDARAAHEALYERFTDHVWEVPASLLAAGSRRWRGVSRRRLRRQLRAASRTGSLHGSLRTVARELIDVGVLRARLVPMRPLLAQHLGELDRGVLTDIDAAEVALEAVRGLQRTLEEHNDDGRLERLLLADAFRSREVVTPAWSIRTALACWESDVLAAGGRGALSLDGDTLASWADHVERDLPAATAGFDGLTGAGAVGTTLQGAVDALILREHVADVTGSTAVPETGDGAEATDLAPTGANARWSAS
jgi:hypothetical protein